MAERWAAGVVVTTSGISSREKKNVQQSIVEAGGSYSPNLSKRVTHVITAEGVQTDKVRAVRSNPQLWPQALVTLDWVHECQRHASRIPPGPFLPKASEQLHDTGAAGTRNPLTAVQHQQQHTGQASVHSRASSRSGASAHTNKGPSHHPWFQPPLSGAAAAAPNNSRIAADTNAGPTSQTRPTDGKPKGAASHNAPFTSFFTSTLTRPAHNPHGHTVKQEVYTPANGASGAPGIHAAPLFPPPPIPAPPPAALLPPYEAELPPAAPCATAQKPAPWRVHFSQVEEDPLARLDAAAPVQAAADATRRPWRVRVSSVPEEADGEGELARRGTGADRDPAAGPVGRAGVGIDEAEEVLEDDDPIAGVLGVGAGTGRAGGAAGGGGGGAAARPPVRVVHLEDDEEPAGPLPGALAGLAAKPWHVRHAPSSASQQLPPAAAQTSAHPAPGPWVEDVRRAGAGQPGAQLHDSQHSYSVTGSGGAGVGEGREAGERHPSAVALLEALTSPRSSQDPRGRHGGPQPLQGAGRVEAVGAKGPAGLVGLAWGAGLHAEEDGGGAWGPSLTQLAADMQALRQDLPLRTAEVSTGGASPQGSRDGDHGRGGSPDITGGGQGERSPGNAECEQQELPSGLGLGSDSVGRRTIIPAVADSARELGTDGPAPWPQDTGPARNAGGPLAGALTAARHGLDGGRLQQPVEERTGWAPYDGGSEHAAFEPGLSQLVAQLQEARTGLQKPLAAPEVMGPAAGAQDSGAQLAPEQPPYRPAPGVDAGRQPDPSWNQEQLAWDGRVGQQRGELGDHLSPGQPAVRGQADDVLHPERRPVARWAGPESFSQLLESMRDIRLGLQPAAGRYSSETGGGEGMAGAGADVVGEGGGVGGEVEHGGHTAAWAAQEDVSPLRGAPVSPAGVAAYAMPAARGPYQQHGETPAECMPWVAQADAAVGSAGLRAAAEVQGVGEGAARSPAAAGGDAVADSPPAEHGADDVSFSQLVQLMQQQKLRRQLQQVEEEEEEAMMLGPGSAGRGSEQPSAGQVALGVRSQGAASGGGPEEGSQDPSRRGTPSWGGFGLGGGGDGMEVSPGLAPSYGVGGFVHRMHGGDGGGGGGGDEGGHGAAASRGMDWEEGAVHGRSPGLQLGYLQQQGGVRGGESATPQLYRGSARQSPCGEGGSGAAGGLSQSAAAPLLSAQAAGAGTGGANDSGGDTPIGAGAAATPELSFRPDGSQPSPSLLGAEGRSQSASPADQADEGTDGSDGMLTDTSAAAATATPGPLSAHSSRSELQPMALLSRFGLVSPGVLPPGSGCDTGRGAAYEGMAARGTPGREASNPMGDAPRDLTPPGSTSPGQQQHQRRADDGPGPAMQGVEASGRRVGSSRARQQASGKRDARTPAPPSTQGKHKRLQQRPTPTPMKSRSLLGLQLQPQHAPEGGEDDTDPEPDSHRLAQHPTSPTGGPAPGLDAAAPPRGQRGSQQYTGSHGSSQLGSQAAPTLRSLLAAPSQGGAGPAAAVAAAAPPAGSLASHLLAASYSAIADCGRAPADHPRAPSQVQGPTGLHAGSQESQGQLRGMLVQSQAAALDARVVMERLSQMPWANSLGLGARAGGQQQAATPVAGRQGGRGMGASGLLHGGGLLQEVRTVLKGTPGMWSDSEDETGSGRAEEEGEEEEDGEEEGVARGVFNVFGGARARCREAAAAAAAAATVTGSVPSVGGGDARAGRCDQPGALGAGRVRSVQPSPAAGVAVLAAAQLPLPQDSQGTQQEQQHQQPSMGRNPGEDAAGQGQVVQDAGGTGSQCASGPSLVLRLGSDPGDADMDREGLPQEHAGSKVEPAAAAFASLSLGAGSQRVGQEGGRGVTAEAEASLANGSTEEAVGADGGSAFGGLGLADAAGDAGMGLEPGSPAEGGPGSVRSYGSPGTGEGANEAGDVREGAEAAAPCSQQQGGMLLQGAGVILDRQLPPEVAERCAAAVLALGGHVSRTSHLGCGAMAVVCPPARAAAWLAWGAHVLSPDSLARLAGFAGPAADDPQPAGGPETPADELLCFSRDVVRELQAAVEDAAGMRRHDSQAAGQRQATHGQQQQQQLRAGASGGNPVGLSELAGLADRDSRAGREGAPGGAGNGSGVRRYEEGEGDPWVCPAARRRYVQELKAAEDAAGTRLLGLLDGSSAAPPAPPPAPLRLLDGVCWCLTAAPHTALVPAGWRGSGGGSGGPQGGDPEPHAERGAEGLGWGPADSQAEGLGLGCSFTQAMEEELRGVAEDDLDACVFRGPRLTLLLPQDQHGLLGHHAVTLTPARPTPVPQPGSTVPAAGAGTAGSTGVGAGTPHTHTHTQEQGITLRQVLGALHQHYTGQLPTREMAAAMAVHPRLRRTLQVAWQTGSGTPRAQLLGRRTALAGLKRASLAASLAVYEVLLVE